MSLHFDLIATSDDAAPSAEFRLRDAHGSHLAYHWTDFRAISPSQRQRLFDLRNDLRLYVPEGGEAVAVAEIGNCIAEEVLGEDIFETLWESQSQRTLRIQLPGATGTENHLAAALATLDQWLRERRVNVDELQAAVDQFLDQARQLAGANP